MQITRTLLVASLLGWSLYAAPAEAFRCGGRIVSEGDDISRVYYICGEPASTQHWTEVKVRPIYHYAHYRPSHGPVEIQVEEWTYNLGARRFMRRLRFENGVLVKIRELRYGY